jgi:hypothetical protein
LLSRNNSNILVVPKEYQTKPILETISYHYLDQNKVCVRKIKKSDLQFVNTELGYILDFSSIKIDTTVIIDLKYYYEVKSKQELNFYFDKDMKYNDIKIELNIPEIYNYKIRYEENFFSMEIDEGNLGPEIGYRSSGPGILGSYFVEMLQRKNPNAIFIPVNCQSNTITFKLKRNTGIDYVVSPKGINLSLLEINEIR